MKVVDASRLTDDEFSAALQLRRELDLAKDPDISATTSEELRLLVTLDETENSDHDRVVGFEKGRAVALGHLERTRDRANKGFAIVELDARPDDLARSGPVLARLLDLAEADGRTSILVWGDLHQARDTFWTGFGATRRQIDRDSDLRLAEVDPDLMERWIDARSDRAASVELVGWVGVPPEEHLEAFVVTRNAMNDAPRDEIEVEDFVMTADQVVANFRAHATIGWDIHVLLAIEADGSPVAMTSVFVNRHRPDASWQGDTVVLREHRRRGIGRWIKAEMWRRLRENHPELTRLRTGNADSNDGMLAINVAMGYRPAHESAGWQADVATLRAGLAGQ